MPDVVDLILQISEHLHQYGGSANDAAAVTRVLGTEDGTELAGGLTQGRAAIEELMASAKNLGDATAKAVDPAREFQRTEAEITEQIKTAALPALRYVVDGLEGLRIIYAALKAGDVVEFRDSARCRIRSTHRYGSSLCRCFKGYCGVELGEGEGRRGGLLQSVGGARRIPCGGTRTGSGRIPKHFR